MAGRIGRALALAVLLVGCAGAALAEPAAETTRRVFYRYTDASGNLHFVQSLEAVPAERRGAAVRIEVVRPPKPERAQPREDARPRRERPRRRPLAPTPTVVVYTAPWCGWCRKTLAHLDDRGVAYVEKDVDASPGHRDELVRKAGRATIPVVEIDGTLVRGFEPERIDALLARGR